MTNPREPVRTRIAIRELQGQYLRQRVVVLPVRQQLREQKGQLDALLLHINALEKVRGWTKNPDHIQALKDLQTLTARKIETEGSLHQENAKLSLIRTNIQEAEVNHLRYLATRHDPQHAALAQEHAQTETLLESINAEIDELNRRNSILQDQRLVARGLFASQRTALKKIVAEWTKTRAMKARMARTARQRSLRKAPQP